MYKIRSQDDDIPEKNPEKKKEVYQRGFRFCAIGGM
jgi:hypothetical protein